MDVIVIGAGPTGLMLAHELALGGARAVVVDRLAERVRQVKGGTLQPRTAELLDARGLLDAVRAHALPRENVGGHFAGLPVPLDCAPWGTRTPYPISIPQWRVEEVLEAAATGRGAEVLHGREVTAIAADDAGVTVTAGGTELRAAYAVACDGAHSTVRGLLGLPFPGRPGTFRAALADIRLASASGLVPATMGHFSDVTRQADGFWGMLVPVGDREYRFTFGRADGPAEPTAEGIGAALTALYGDGTRLAEIHTASTFTDATRQLERYRHGRVLFAGDAAHIHPPWGGQGLNLGVQDAVNLGWKLAATVAGWAPYGLLDSYETERHPMAARVLHHTAAQRALASREAGPDVAALRDIVTDLLRLPDANRYIAGMMSGLDAPGRLPDVDLVTPDGPTRPAELLRTGRGLLLDTGSRTELPTGWADRVDRVGVADGAGLGPALVRPDATVCWSGEGALVDALTATFGAPSPVAASAAAG